jgi:hypothetical protein
MTGKLTETAAMPQFPESSFKYNPLLHVRVLFIRFVQGLFSSAPSGCYRWSDDDETTELYISGEEEISPVVVEKVPAISFVRGPVSFYSLGIDDMDGYDFALDKKTKDVLIPGTMTINAASRASLESEQIAWVVADHIWLLRDLLMKLGFFEIGRGIQVGAPSKAGSIISGDRGTEFFATSVSVPFQFSRRSSFTPLGLEIARNIDQHLNLRPGLPVRSEGAPGTSQLSQGQGHEVPVGYKYTFPESFAPQARDLKQPITALQPHPLNPSQMVCVRTVRPNRAGANLHLSRAAIPIQQPCVEQSSLQAPAFEQKG